MSWSMLLEIVFFHSCPIEAKEAWSASRRGPAGLVNQIRVRHAHSMTTYF